jgi:putative transposase
MDIDPYITVSQAVELTGLARRTVFHHISSGRFPAKPSDEVSANGKPQSLIRLASLPDEAQIRYWDKERKRGSGSTLNLAEVPPSACEEGLRRLSIVQAACAIMESNEQVTPRLTQLAQGHDVVLGTLYRWIASHRSQGMAGLIPGWGKKKGAFTALSEELQGIIKDEWLRPERPSVKKVWRSIEAFCNAAHLQCPSIKTVHRFLQTIPRPVVLFHRYGNQAYRAHGQPKVHRDYKDLAVGEMWVGDHRELDLFVTEGGKIFRPWLTAWMDLRSRAVVGWYLSVVPNAYTIALALRSGILRFGLPQRLYMDNGKDFTANFWGGKTKYSRNVTLNADSRAVLALLNIGVVHAQARSPWSKAIEPWFGHTLPTWERTLPGWCGRDNKERPEKLKSEIKDGLFLTLEECRARLADCIEAYHDREHSGAGMNGAMPRSCWQGVEKRIPTARALDMILTKHKPAMVYQDGIRLFGFKYWHDSLNVHIKQTVEIRYDPGNIGTVVVFKNNSFVCEARADKPFSMSLSEAEKHEISRRRKAARKVITDYAQHRAIAMDPDKAIELIANARTSAQVYQFPPSPRPEPGGRVVPTITGFERAADALSHQAGHSTHGRKQQARGRPAPDPAAEAEHDELHKELLSGPSLAEIRKQEQEERDRFWKEILET